MSVLKWKQKEFRKWRERKKSSLNSTVEWSLSAFAKSEFSFRSTFNVCVKLRRISFFFSFPSRLFCFCFSRLLHSPHIIPFVNRITSDEMAFIFALHGQLTCHCTLCVPSNHFFNVVNRHQRRRLWKKITTKTATKRVRERVRNCHTKMCHAKEREPIG